MYEGMASSWSIGVEREPLWNLYYRPGANRFARTQLAFYSRYVGVCVYMCMYFYGYVHVGAGACKDQKVVPDPLQKELRAVVSNPKFWDPNSARAIHSLNSPAFVCNFKHFLLQNRTSPHHIFFISICSFSCSLSQKTWIRAVNSIHAKAWMLSCLDIYSIKQISLLILSSALLKVPGHRRLTNSFFFII